jgi:hypothetical protein
MGVPSGPIPNLSAPIPWSDFVRAGVSITRATFGPLDDASWIEVAPGIELPERFMYREQPSGGEPSVTIVMRVVNGRPVCEHIGLDPNTDPTGRHTPLTATSIRAPNIGRMLRDAPVVNARISSDSEPAKPEEDWAYWVRRRLEAATEARERGEEDPVRAAFRPRRQREAIPMDDHRLVEMAKKYNAAVGLGQAPTSAIQKAYDVSRSTASRWVRRARDLGLIAEPHSH